MVVDSSSVVAIVQQEPDASMHVSAILNDVTRLISAATLLEASIVCMRWNKGDSLAALDVLVARLKLTVVSVNHEQALIARDAYRKFGKGRHVAGLNFGDCFSYALSKYSGEPLLFKGNDFNHTDVAIA
jgi:ribonuclease VapC